MIVANVIILKTVKGYYHADSDKGLYEPNVVKATRSVLRRVRGRNPLFLSDKGISTVLRREDWSNLILLSDNFKQYKDGVSRIRPSKDSLKKFKQEVDYIFKSSYGHNVGVLIYRLNPLIRGTANYWRYAIFGIKDLSKMDNYIWNKTFNFLNRLHPNKSWNWIKNRYFTLRSDGIHHSNWTLTDPISGNTLEKMSWYNPRKYIMIKHDYSLYDGDKKDYFETRKHKFYISTR